MAGGGRGRHRHTDTGEDDKRKPLLAKDGTRVEIPEAHARTVPVASLWSRGLQRKIAFVAVIDLLATITLWFSFFCLVGGRAPVGPGENNRTSNATHVLGAIGSSGSCLSTLWSQDIVSFSFKTSNVEFVASSIARVIVLLLLVFSGSWLRSDSADHILESVALWTTGLMFIFLVAKDMLYDASLYSIPVLATISVGSLVLTGAEYLLGG